MCYRKAVTEPRKRGRPPKPEGPLKGRTIRMGDTWDDARAAADANGESFATFVERALRAEIKKVMRRLTPGAK